MAIGPMHLPFKLNGLEPAISEMTVIYHFGKHQLPHSHGYSDA